MACIFMMLYSSVNFELNWCIPLQKVLIRNQKCDALAEADTDSHDPYV